MTAPRGESSPRRGRPRAPAPRRVAAIAPLPAVPLALLGVACALKLIVVWQLKDHVLTQSDAGLDTTAYVDLATRVVGGDLGLGPGLYFLSPLYIYFLAAVLALTHSFTAVRLVQIALGTATVALVYVGAATWFGRRAAWLAALSATFTGLFTFYESLLLQAALDPFLTAAATVCLALGLTRHEWRWYALSGVAFGIQTCNRPNVAIPAACTALLLVAVGRRRAALIFVGGVVLALSPVTLRNRVVAGEWSPLASSHGGLNFYIGNNPDADGTYRAIPGISANIKGQAEDARRLAEAKTGRTLDDGAVSAYFYGLGLAWMRDRPIAAATLFVRKVSLMFSAGYAWLNYSYPFFSRDAGTLLRVLAVGPWLLIPLGLVGIVVAAPRAGLADYVIWASFVPTYAVAVAAFYVTDRYQLPLLIPLCMGAGAALDRFAAALSARRWMPLAAAAAVAIVLAAWVNRPLALDDGVGEERLRMAERLITLGRYPEAELWAARAEQVAARPGVVHFRVAQRLVASDRLAAAIVHFEQALALDPSQAVADYALGETLLEAARPQDAIPHLRRALAAGVQVDQSGYDLVRALGASADRAGAARVLASVRPARDDDAERWAALGQLGVQLQEPQLAEMFCRRALALRPDTAVAHAVLGRALNMAGRWSDAVQELVAAVRLDPQDANAQADLALAERRLRHDSEPAAITKKRPSPRVRQGPKEDG
jgi:tetratricopeptide (TPR) repeat protein